jgi:taurine dioxygenase
MATAAAAAHTNGREIAPGVFARPLAPNIGAEIVGVDLSKEIAPETFKAIEQAWFDHGVILFRNQSFTEDEQARFGSLFGPLASTINKHNSAVKHPAMLLISNVREDGKLIGALPDGEMLFHSDQCYVEKPCSGAMLYAIEIPSKGGDTIFANATKAYETLSPEMKLRLSGLKAVNVYDYDAWLTKSPVSETAPRYAHPIVRVHPRTGRKALFVNRMMSNHIVGMDRAESDKLLGQLFDHIEQPQFLYAHTWTPGDVLLWDNRCTLHARTDFDAGERRMLRRVTILGEPVRSE